MEMNVPKFVLWIQLRKVVKMVMDYVFVAKRENGMFADDRMKKYKICTK
jgi:hypothetical protein